MNTLPPHYTNEETGISYTLVGDYYIPNFALEIEAAPDEPEYDIFGWGLQRQHYLKNHRKGLYSQLVMSGKLNTSLTGGDQTRIKAPAGVACADSHKTIGNKKGVG
jgi:hypothetical protein